MSGNSRNLTAKFGLEASGFKKGANEVRAELTELNNAMLQNKNQRKELEEKIKSLTKQQKSNKQATDEEKRKYQELQGEIDKTTLELAGLKTKEQELKSQIKDTTKELGEHTDEAKKLSDAYQNVGKALKAGVQFTGTAVAGMFAYTAEIAASADEINTLAKQTGLSTAEIQKFMYAAELIDVPLETLTGSMAKLVKNMNTATSGTGDAYDAFLALGVSITDSTGTLRSNQDVFDECISALSKIEDETQRDAYAMSIFGKSAQDLNPLILGGTEQLKAFGDELEREGLILSQTELDKLNEFNDKIDTFKAKFQATMAEGALEGVDAFEELLEQSDDIVDMIADLITGFAKFTGFVVSQKEAVLALVVAYGSYKAVMSIGTLISSVVTVTKSLTTATKGATVAQHGMNAACNVNPYILLASALAALATGLITYAVAWNKAEEESLKLVGTNKSLNAEVEKAVDNVKAENEVIKSKGERYEELRKKIKRTVDEERELYSIAAELEAAHPNQIELIEDEAGSYRELGTQISDVCSELEMLARKQAAVESLTERYKAKFDLEIRIKEEEASELENNTQANPDEIAPAGEAKSDKLKTEYRELCAEIARIEREYGFALESQNDFGEGADVLNSKLVALGETTKLMTSVEIELANTNELSEETLNAIIAAYPELQDEVNNYINNVGTVEDVINHLNIAYQNDVANNKEALQAKLNTDTEYYQKLKEMNGSAINALASEYGVDLSNYESYGEAKLAIQAAFLSKLASNWQKYYDAKSGQYIIDDHDLTQYKRELMLSGMSSSEADAEIAIYRTEQNETQAAVNAWNAFLAENPLGVDLTDYSKWYTPKLTDATTNDIVTGGSGSSSADKEISIFQLANEAFKQLTDDRIAEIQRLTNAENEATDERIAAINEEIAAREKLKEETDLQEQIEFIEAQLKYSQLDEFERAELERQLQGLYDEKSDREWLESKEKEKEALEAEKTTRNEESASLIDQLKANQSAASTLFTDLNNGSPSVSSIINNNSKQANVNIITDALSEGQVEKIVIDALGLGMIT